MTDRKSAWTILEERGTVRGADDLLAHAEAILATEAVADHVMELDTSDRGGSLMNPAKRRTRAFLAAAGAFALVVVSLSIAGLGSRVGDSPDASQPPSTGIDATQSIPAPSVTLIPMSEWPMPAVDPVIALPQCPSSDGQAANTFGQWYDFLGRDIGSANLRHVPLGEVAATMPVPRAGSGSLLSNESLSGACTIAVADGDLLAWALVSSNGSIVMSAASVPKSDNSVPDVVFDAAGEYQQWRVATGQGFSGPISEDGTFHAAIGHRRGTSDQFVFSSRLIAGSYDPALVPSGATYYGTVMNSLALSTLDARYLLPNPKLDTYALPSELPDGYGICSLILGFLMYEDIGESTEDQQQMILCDANGGEIIVTSALERGSNSPFLSPIPDGTTEVLVNGHAVREWPTDDTISIQLDRAGWETFRIDAPSDLGRDVLRAVAGSTMLGQPAPEDPSAGIATIGVGDGLPDDTTEVYIPDLRDQDETGITTFDLIQDATYIDPDVMSTSMIAIHGIGLGGYSALPVTYEFIIWDPGYDRESALFDLPELGVTIRVSQQLATDENPTDYALGPVQRTEGIWLVSTDGFNRDRIQLIAYSPSIERAVNVVFEQRVRYADRDDSGFPIDMDTALEIMTGILNSIAVSAP